MPNPPVNEEPLTPDPPSYTLPPPYTSNHAPTPPYTTPDTTPDTPLGHPKHPRPTPPPHPPPYLRTLGVEWSKSAITAGDGTIMPSADTPSASHA